MNTLKNIGIAVIFCLITHKAKNIACFATPNASLDRYFDVLFSIHNRSITFSDRNCLVALFWLQSTQKMSMHIKKHPADSFQGLLNLLYYRHLCDKPPKNYASKAADIEIMRVLTLQGTHKALLCFCNIIRILRAGT